MDCATEPTTEDRNSNEHDNQQALDTTNDVLEPPTSALAPYEPFVQWLLSSSIEELTSIHTTLPQEIAKLHDMPSRDRKSNQTERAHTVFACAEIDAEYEAISDLLSIAQREWNGTSDKLLDLQEERDHSREQIALLESRIIKHLQDRELAIAEKYTTEKQIVEIETWKAQHPQRSGSLHFGFLKVGTTPLSPTSTHNTREIEKLQKDIADTKMETAVAKSELDTHYYRLRQLEKESVSIKLEISQAKALEDDLRTSLDQIRRARRTSWVKL